MFIDAIYVGIELHYVFCRTSLNSAYFAFELMPPVFKYDIISVPSGDGEIVTVDESLLSLGVFGESSFPFVGCGGGVWP